MALDLDALSRMHVRRGWFADVVLPSGTRYFHTGLNPQIFNGKEYEGVNDPLGSQLVGLGSIEEPEFGQAPVIDIGLSGANRTFLKTMWDDRHAIEGAAATFHFVLYDWEMGSELASLLAVFPGKLTAPKFNMSGSAIRAVSLKVTSPFEGLNFPESQSHWSPAAQRERWPADRGLDHINSDIIERYIA